jgi:hypothetical protein
LFSKKLKNISTIPSTSSALGIAAEILLHLLFPKDWSGKPGSRRPWRESAQGFKILEMVIGGGLQELPGFGI